jgi:thioredoxin reductase (NADPH)
LLTALRGQAERFGAETIRCNVSAVDLGRRPFTITTDDGPIEARTLIVATGASAKLLGLPSERKLMGRGVSTCATCDGFFFRGKPIAVIGGGILEVEAPIALAKVMPIDPTTGKPTRVSYKTKKEKKVRVGKSGAEISEAKK